MTHPLELIHPRNFKYLSYHLSSLVKGRLWLQILIGLFLGLIVGALLSPTADLVSREAANIAGSWLALPGRFFLTMVQMIVVPLVFASVIRGIAANENVEQLKTTGVGLVVYFLLTTTIAVSIGIGIAYFLQPGQYVDLSVAQSQEQNIENSVASEVDSEPLSASTLPQSFISILPDNPLEDAVQANMLQIVLFSVIVGLALVNIKPKKSKPLLDLLGSLQSVSMTVVKWVMLIAPFAVFGLMAQLTLESGLSSLYGVGVYVATVIIGLLLLLCVYLLIVFLVGGWTPGAFLAKVRELQLLAFSTGSSAAVMPLSIKTAEEKLNVRPSVSQFVIPIGATVNMDATALFQGIATIFLTQVYGLDLGIGVIITLIATIVGSSIGTPATPGVGIVVLSVVLKGAGIPLEGIALIIGVDRILEMMRTSINVTGDIVASVVMDRFSRIKKTLTEEFATEKEVERLQEELDEDTITEDEYPVRPEPA